MLNNGNANIRNNGNGNGNRYGFRGFVFRAYLGNPRFGNRRALGGNVMIRNLLIDTLALIGIFAMVFCILFAGYGFSNEEGLGIFFPGFGGYFWELN